MVVERLLNIGHTLVAGTLIATSIGGLTFIGAAVGDTFYRHRQRKRALLKEKEASQ